jgi:septal ring factor EnvC (AmiA/AmiB activator)
MDPLVTDKSAKAAEIHSTLDYLQEELLDKVETLEHQAKVLEDRARDLGDQATTLAELAKDVKTHIKDFDELRNHVEGLFSSSEGENESEDSDLLSTGSCDCSERSGIQRVREDLGEIKPLTRRQAREEAQRRARDWASTLRTAKEPGEPRIDFQGAAWK